MNAVTLSRFSVAIVVALAASGSFGEVIDDAVVVALGALPAQAACPPPPSWLRLDGARAASASFGEVIDDMAARDVVLLGEQHDNADHHRWQLHTLAALRARRPDMVIGFEMFPRRGQAVLDRWVAGELTPEGFLAEVGWEEVWGLPAHLYLPLFEFARMHRIPMLALNVERKLTASIAEKGFDAVPEREREGVSRPAAAPPEYLDELFEVYRSHAGVQGRNPETATKADAAFLHFVEAQQTWDRAMAQVLAARKPAAGNKPLAVGIVGSGHVRYGHGIPLQLRDLGIASVGTLLPLDDCAQVKPGLADAAFLLPKTLAAKPPPPRLGVRLEQHGNSVRIVEVTQGSLAERSGLQAGDTVVSAAGREISRVGALIDAVRGPPEGTWLPLEVKRGEQTREVLVKFPPKK
jgi:uncharacterized iron-regulated protein